MNKEKGAFLKKILLFLSCLVLVLILSSCNGSVDKVFTVSEIHNNFKDTSKNISGTTSDKYETQFAFEQLDNTVGLSNSSVNCIFQDSQHFLWIGTWDGLNRYDGKNFKIFRPEADSGNSLSNQVVTKVIEDKAGQIWILTLHGINKYDKKSNKITNYYFSRKGKAPLSESEFNIAIDNNGQLFCAVKEWGIGYFDGSKFQKLNDNFLNHRTFKKMGFSAKGKLVLLTDSNELFEIKLIKNKSGLKIGKITSLSKDTQSFEILPNGETCVVSINGTVILLDADLLKTKSLDFDHVKNIVGHYDDGIVFSGRNGYTITDFKGNKIETSWSRYLKNHKITSLTQGNENMIWAGTDGDGLFKIYPIKKSFNLVSEKKLPGLDGGIVRSFAESDQNTMWVGTKGKGLFKISGEFSNSEKPLSFIKFDENSGLSDNSVYSLFKGNDDLLFIGTDGEGISVYDLKNSKLINWKEIKGIDHSDYFKSVYAIHQDNSGNLWLGTNGYGMVRCRIIRDNGKIVLTDFKRYNAGGNNKLSSNIIFSIISKDDEHLWVGTRLGGLNLFDKKSEKFKVFKNVAGDPHSLSSNDILCLAKENESGKLWIGTSFGLNVLEKLETDGSANFKNFTVKDGLPNNTIHGIISYGNSSFWLSTNLGLSNFIYKSNKAKFSNYTLAEGLQNNEFADGAFYKSSYTGLLFMGGIKGFNYFFSEEIKESQVIPDLLIDKVSGQNTKVPYYQGLVISQKSKNTPSIILKHDQNFFDIHLSALTFLNNEKCQYAYKLDGFDRNWNSIGNRNIISFTNVPKGNYSLWMKWSNADGVWSESIKAIDISVKPIFWQSNLALLVYSILLISFLFFVRSYFLKKQSLRQNIIFRQKEEELHENRLNFFTNIAHEFLTPLTLIIGPVQKISELKNLDDKNQKFVRLIERNAARLLVLTQQLLEFRKAEHEEIGLKIKEFDLVNLVEQIAELFDDWALNKEINYNVMFPQSLQGWYDKDKIEKIIFNLMSNAFKYTPKGGQIEVIINKETSESRRLKIEINNTGKGISKEKLESLFDRFFLSDAGSAVDPDVLRTGIGLAYVKKLVTALGGEIKVSSEPDVKTIMTVLLPCSREFFKEGDFITDSNPIVISRDLISTISEVEIKKELLPNKISNLENIEKQQKIILIVEDDKEIHTFLNHLLEKEYTILSAYNGIEALEIIESGVPDLIISDVMMPLMDGVELCRKIKSDLLTCNIPFIMLTAKESVAHRIEGLESGANSYIPKPFYPEHLLIRIQKLLEEKERIGLHFSQEQNIENFKTPIAVENQKEFIKDVIDVIRKNIDREDLQSAFIEKTLGISTSQLYRKTKEAFGVSPGELIRTLRLKFAAELLRKNEITVSEVCYKSGFNNRSYFYREFKKVYGLTPKSYQLDFKLKRANF